MFLTRFSDIFDFPEGFTKAEDIDAAKRKRNIEDSSGATAQGKPKAR